MTFAVGQQAAAPHHTKQWEVVHSAWRHFAASLIYLFSPLNTHATSAGILYIYLA
jgi:hypothetical protein